MPTPDPPAVETPPSLSVAQAQTLLSSFTAFLTLTLHSLLYHRGLYPAATFLTARAFNLPVRQSRHPGLCAWIADAVAAAAAQLRDGALARIVVVMHAPETLAVLERWVLDVDAFPAAWGSAEDPAAGGEGGVEDEDEDEGEVDDDEDEEEEEEEDPVNWTDVNEALRGALTRIAYAAESMPALPEGSTFTLAVELRDEASAPIGHPQPWIPSQRELQPPTAKAPGRGSALGGTSITPIRSVHAGPLFFECWIEQSLATPPRSSS